MKNDPSILRLHAYIKRVLQISAYFPANMACAILYVVSQVLRAKKISKKILTKTEVNSPNDGEKQDSNKKIDEIVAVEEPPPKKEKKKQKENTIILSNVILDTTGTKENLKNVEAEAEAEKIVEIKPEYKATCYDPFARNPLFAGANLTIYTELVALCKHFHPSVALFADTILEGKYLLLFPMQNLGIIMMLIKQNWFF